MKILCPRCDQDYVVRAVIKPLDFKILICPECEAMWAKDTPVLKQTFFNYWAFTSAHNLPCTWDILEQVEDWPCEC